MVKTIKELALEAYPIKMVKTYGYLPGGDITEKDENLLERMAIEKGANAVLSEIENAIKECELGGSPYAAVLDKIKELKGK